MKSVIGWREGEFDIDAEKLSFKHMLVMGVVGPQARCGSLLKSCKTSGTKSFACASVVQCLGRQDT